MDFLKAHTRSVVSSFLAVILLGVGLYHYSFSPPDNFPSGSIVVVAQGAPAPRVAAQLADAGVIAHPLILELMLRVGAGSTRIQSGAYLFSKPQNVFTIAYRLVTGEYGLPAVRITFVEGITVREMSEQVAEAFPNISAAAFSTLAEKQEGYLFPDTYLFSPTADATEIVKTLRDTFDTKTKSLMSDIKASGHSLSDVVQMAAIIEKEARDNTDRHMIAGVLWHRLAITMRLQVDAASETYQHTGFPSTPICNPGLDALEAALHPTKTEYLYYLTGKDGKFYYAKTFAAHQANLRKYLN